MRPGRACRRAIPGVAASGRNPLRPPCGPDRRPSPQHRGPRRSFALIAAIVASLETRPNNLLRPLARTGCASNGAPRTRRAGDGSVRRMARRMRDSSPQVHGCAVGEPRRPHAHPEHTDVLRTCSRGGLLFGDFLLAKQEKVTRAPGRARKKTGTSNVTEQMTLGFPRMELWSAPTYM